MNWNTNSVPEIRIGNQGNIISQFVNSVIRKNNDPTPIKVKTYQSYNSSLSSETNTLSKDEIYNQFQSKLADLNSLNLLKQTNRYVILDLSKNKSFMKSLSTFLEEMGHPVRAPRYATRSGVKVRSKAEVLCANFFTSLELPFIFEPVIIMFGKKPFFKRPDFYFPHFDLFHEHFGYCSNPEYVEGMKKKIEIYNSFNIPFIYTLPEDEENIDNVLTSKLQHRINKSNS